ncbi:MAG: hypothetical protein ACW97X_08495, partial [Candidatus Hodarchaeales archaeon]
NVTKFGERKNLSVLLSKALKTQFNDNEIYKIISNPTHYFPSPELALQISLLTRVPLHPRYSFNWNEIAISDFLKLLEMINRSENDLLPNKKDLRTILKQLGVPYTIENDFINTEQFKLLFQAFKGKEKKAIEILSKEHKTLKIEEIIELLINIPVRSLCSRRIGLKILRSEKARLKHINPPTHILFPIGSYGGAQRDLLRAKEQNFIEIQLSERFCNSCGIDSFTVFCPSCKQKTIQRYICKNGHIFKTQECPECNQYGYSARKKRINIAGMLDSALNKVKSANIKRIKGVSYLTSKNRIPEHIIKGVLRATHEMFVYKDGTSRFDQTNAILTHFTPKEINVSIKVLSRLGYSYDIYGEDISNEDQIIELLPYDVIVSRKIGNSLIKLSNFLDDELVYLYDMSPYYRIDSLDNLFGALIIGIAPFSTVGIVGRIIGHTDNEVLYAHPLWHRLKTRDCKGDIDSITLLLDVFLNFSNEFIPSSRGGSLDVPYIIHLSDNWEDTSIYAKYNSIPLNLMFYQKLERGQSTKDLVITSKSHLFTSFQNIHRIDNISLFKFNNKFTESKIIAKIETELRVLSRLRGIEEGIFVDSILENDFLEKITTSISRFFLQPVRCRTCNTTFRRVPLTKNCPVCHRQTIGLTLSEGWVLRYLQLIEQLKDMYLSDVSDYSQSWIDLIELNKRLLFDRGPRRTTLM